MTIALAYRLVHAETPYRDISRTSAGDIGVEYRTTGHEEAKEVDAMVLFHMIHFLSGFRYIVSRADTASSSSFFILHPCVPETLCQTPKETIPFSSPFHFISH